MPSFGYALVVAGVMALLGWGQYQRAERISEEARAVTQERDQALAGFSDLQTANARVTAAEAVKAKELNVLRVANEKLLRSLASVPDDGCLDRKLPPAIADDLLREPSSDGALGPPATPDARAAPDPAVDRPNLSRSGRLLAPAPGECDGQRGGQSRGPRCA